MTVRFASGSSCSRSTSIVLTMLPSLLPPSFSVTLVSSRRALWRGYPLSMAHRDTPDGGDLPPSCAGTCRCRTEYRISAPLPHLRPRTLWMHSVLRVHPHSSHRLRGAGLGVDEGGDGGVVAQLVEAAAAAGPDAADRDAQLGADLGVRQRRV